MRERGLVERPCQASTSTSGGGVGGGVGPPGVIRTPATSPDECGVVVQVGHVAGGVARRVSHFESARSEQTLTAVQDSQL